MRVDPHRREVLRLGLLAGAAVALGCAGEPVDTDDPTLARTCEPPEPDLACAPTNDDIEGPFWIEGVPVRDVLVGAGEPGVRLRLEGVVRDASCAAVSGAVVEIWHADADGAYDDSEDLRFRGQVATDAAGQYRFETIVPGRYLNGATYRPSHVHMKVHVGGAERLTTQVYFEGDPYLEADPWAESARTVCLEEAAEGHAATFDVTLA
jgi:protocatechuate 3,4-dioxygenase beta subunit